MIVIMIMTIVVIKFKLIKIKGSYYKLLCYILRPYFLNYLDKKKIQWIYH
jgi:hypothetical protein